MSDLRKLLSEAIDSIPDNHNPGPFRLYASGPNSEKLFRKLFGDSIEIVRADRV